MNPQITQLYQIAQKPSRLILGLMSGTSLDGLDLALCRFSGFGLKTQVELVKHHTIPYPEEFKQSIREVFAKDQIHFPSLSTLNAQIGRLHAQFILDSLLSWGIAPKEVDAIASHGQTVMHRPMRSGNLPNSTLQIGDADHIAHLTGIITLSDFRQKHIAGGGEGAPLAVYGDYFLFSKKEEHRILLNIGGIGNFTYLSASQDPKDILVTDTGPGNTLLDAYVRQHFPGFHYDKDARLARQGILHIPLLDSLLNLPFFNEAFPKSTGPEYFNLELLNQVIHKNGYSLTPVDTLRTLTELTAQSISNAMQNYIPAIQTIHCNLIVSGGGSKNPLLMERLSKINPKMKVVESDQLGIASEAKEAVLFALLANETLMDDQVASNRRLGDSPWLSLGKISLPN
ncbi:anhydro-N-acetylmuramic acid kinase [Aquirufa ecclesiirivi]|uniref:Anhydro-N-acetylmuramic acid kinase n=1 Tax=Aquirufa ecclesiirivi TaxID=2715124 RepID=A0ABT4JIX5_9BACT|nr:anhydro-N-acetylmuramic acid kinase [Aquirufa ecclesiirivi]MCZ2475526.1 anhydro-N-acetylmuramic acid kinase [Aquirufa ecclesiirivi]